MANLGSIVNMFRRLGVQAEVTSTTDGIAAAQRLILPGVGAFDEAMRTIQGRGIIESLRQRVLVDRVPLLGICLGMQILVERSEEGSLPGLGWIPGEVKKFQFAADAQGLKIPHMGWNTIRQTRTDPLFANLPDSSRFYFVHSYHLVLAAANTLGETTYGYAFPSVLRHENMYGVQFHPEKSHRYGMAILKNFSALPV